MFSYLTLMSDTILPSKEWIIKPANMKDNEERFKKLFNTGVKIVNVDREKREVQFIECVIMEEGHARPFYITVPFSDVDEFRSVTRSKRFRDSMFAPKDRGVLLIDVAGYSRYDTLYQSSVLSLFNQALDYSLKKFRRLSGKKCLEQIVPTGDGCFVIFSDCVNDYFLKAAYTLFSEMNRMQDTLIGKFTGQPNSCEKMYLRFGAAIGETDFFYDPAGKRNCYGTGMNETERILTLGRERVESGSHRQDTVDTIFIHGDLSGQAEELLELLRKKGHAPELQDLGPLTDKHGLSRPAYWLHHLPPHEDIPL